MIERHEISIPGVAGGGREVAEVRSPYRGEVIAEVEQADLAACEHALELQTALFRQRDAWLPAHERIGILRRAAALIAERREELARLIALEGGKPMRDALVEADRAANGMELCAEAVGHRTGEEIPMGATAASTGRLAFTTYEPIGVVAAVSAFNHPLNLIVHQVGPAVAAGCPVIVKPAGETPLSCLAAVDILRQAGLPAKWCLALPCGTEVAERLVTSDRIGFFSFIGSARVGWYLRSKLSPGVRCALEHGGAAPVFVDRSADLDAGVSQLLKGGYYHAGQVCVSVQRVFVHDDIKDELVDRLVEGIGALQTGDPLDPDTDVGPLIRPAEVDRVDEWVQEAVGAGAKVAVGGHRLDHQCYEPTLLVDPPLDTKVMQQEVFGPVVAVAGYGELDGAIDRANSVAWAFQAAVLSRDINVALAAARRLDATAVMVNDHTAFRVDWMPFGGRGQSGLGMGGMRYTVEEMTQPKMIVLNGV
ncbi:MAG: aldehyde dehydrogenase family protein [Acidimicrobiales bacterium]